MRRLIAAVAIAALTLLGVEGLVSMTTNRSLLRDVARLSDDDGGDPDLFAGPIGGGPAATGIDDETRRALASVNAGMYRRHPDPLVGYCLRPNSTSRIHEGVIVSDHLGLRARPSGPVPEDAIRVVVLGASIPFGFGVSDDETLAARLEEVLADVRGPEARPVACRTVALGRWGHTNSTRFLLDHWDELRPDIVLYLPFGNELSDTDLVDETGHRSAWPDVATDDPWQQVNETRNQLVLNRAMQRIADRTSDVGVDQLGPQALISDLSRESSLRYDHNVQSIRRVHERMQETGGRLIMLRYRDDAHAWILAERLGKAGLLLPIVPLLSRVDPSFTHVYDAHPNAETLRVFAIWTAQALLEMACIDPGANHPLPEVPAEYTRARSAEVPWGKIARSADSARREARAALQPVVDFRTGRGIRQLYGGLGPFGDAGTRLLVMLAAEGDAVSVELAALPDRADAYPLHVLVLLDGEHAGTLTIPAGGSSTRSFPVPEEHDPARALEVQLIPERWVVVEREGISDVASFRPLRIACEAEER